ncbi:MAG TPA: diguanylate cyclase, partial [Thermoanaerobaculia bacterium]|nr:diguanylate cyclase [Thermoanaerobaculia bacterium]
ALLVSVRGEGLFLLADGAATPFAPQASRWTVDHRVLSSLRLADGRWVLGSVLGGLLIVAPDGRVEQTIDSRVGLADDLVYGLAADRDGSLWVALNTDMARVDVASPLSLVDRRAGLVGSAYYAVRHRGELWVATAAGLFVLDAGAGTAGQPPVAARPVRGLPPSVWSLLSIGDDLLAGTASGVFQVAVRGQPRAVSGVPEVTVYALAASPADPAADPNLAWAGTSEGLHRLSRNGGTWRAGDHRALPSPVRAVVERDGVVWCSTELDGVFGFAVPADGEPLGPPVHHAESEGETNLHRVGDRILVTSGGRVLALDEARGAVVEEPGLDRLGRHEFVYDLAEDAAGNLWLNSRPPSVAQAEPGGGWAAPRPLVEVTARAVESLLAEEDGVVWMMSEEGVYRWAGSPAGRGALPAPRIAAVTAGDGETLFAAGVGESALAPPPALELPPDVRRLRIAVAPLAFRPGLAYQTRLDPVDDDWSAPAAEPFSELTRLPSGGYTYRVRTVGPGGETGPETAWGFRVRAPWYRTPWALALWVLVALGLVRGYAGLRNRALGRRAAELERRVGEQTVELRTTVDELRRTQRELEVANEQLQELSLSDDLTGVANRRRLQLSLDAEWGRSIRRQRPIAFVLLDLDQFKLLNDSRGHREGDRALQAVASYLDAAVQRPGDLLVRYGGEEFAVLLPDTDVQGALVLAERLREGLEELGLPHEGNPGGHVTASFGVASLVPTADQRPGVLIEAADHALYRAKTEGRNLVRAEGQEGGAEAASPAAN